MGDIPLPPRDRSKVCKTNPLPLLDSCCDDSIFWYPKINKSSWLNFVEVRWNYWMVVTILEITLWPVWEQYIFFWIHVISRFICTHTYGKKNSAHTVEACASVIPLVWITYHGKPGTIHLRISLIKRGREGSEVTRFSWCTVLWFNWRYNKMSDIFISSILSVIMNCLLNILVFCFTALGMSFSAHLFSKKKQRKGGHSKIRTAPEDAL